MKLHLGCGQRYLDGYVNIDFPLSAHSVQGTSVADLHADILSLRYAPETIEEVRLHHVFEHFSRPVACALLAIWFSWLKPGGVIHLEVPDFQKTARVMLRSFTSFKKRAVAERHLFGSHEAFWAIHCEGYTPGMLKKMVSGYGFRVADIRRNSWLGTYNFELFAEKVSIEIAKKNFEDITAKYLKNYLLDDSESESRLLNIWMEVYKDQIKKGWIQNG